MWKSIQGYEGYYEVSDSGEVRSLDRYVADTTGKHAGKKRLLKGSMMKLTEGKTSRKEGGYLVVNLRKNHTSRVVPVHVLVARAFIPNPDNMPTVNHKDGNKLNNNVSNLEWVSYSENNWRKQSESQTTIPQGSTQEDELPAEAQRPL